MPASPPLLYAPTLHRSLAPAGLPETVSFMHPGLPDIAVGAPAFLPASYPLPPAAARACLNELLALGQGLERAKDGALARKEAQEREDVLSFQEQAALARFAAQGGAAPERETATPSPALRSAQATLLLAWDLEERLLEIQTLEKSVALRWAALAAQLHGEDNAASPPASQTAEEAPWQAVLAAMAAFFPAPGVLVSGHEALRGRLLELDLLRPLPQEPAEALSGRRETLKAATLWARTPLWRVLGISRAPEDKPWLLQPRDMLLLPPETADPTDEERA